jgi:hypothetical protein
MQAFVEEGSKVPRWHRSVALSWQMQFDPKSAAASFSEKDTDELVRIAFLEQDFTQEARELASAELANRGLKITVQDIERVRLRLKEQKREVLEYTLRHLETDATMPAWRRRVRARMAPHRQVLSMVMLALMALAWLNELLEWGFMNLSGRKSEGVALLVGLLWFVFVAPSRDDYRGHGKGKKSPTSVSD